MGSEPKIIKKSLPLSTLRNEEGYLLIVVTVIGLILAIIFGFILPQLHTGQQTRAMNNLNEYRAYEAARKGTNAVRLGLKKPNHFQDLIGPLSNGTGILWAIAQLCGSGKYDVYRDVDNNDQFISGCQGIVLPVNEFGKLQVAVLVSRGGQINNTPDGDSANDSIYFYDDGGQWYSVDNPPAEGWNKFVYENGNIFFCDFDLIGATNYVEAKGTADFKFRKPFYSQNFEALSTGNLNGQDTWSGSGDLVVQGSEVRSGAAAIENTSSGADSIARIIDRTSQGTATIYTRVNDLDSTANLVMYDNSNVKWVAGFNRSTSRIEFGPPTSLVPLSLSPAIDTWYKLDIEWKSGIDQARARINDGTWTGWQAGANPSETAGIDQIRLYTESQLPTNKYFDELVINGAWSFSIGNNGTWRGEYPPGNQLWNYIINIPFNERPYQGQNNDGDGSTDPGDGLSDPDDVLEIFIIIRSSGITVAPGPQLIHDATGGHLPNPMRQVLEAGFYLADDGTGLKEKRFYFGQAHNLAD